MTVLECWGVTTTITQQSSCTSNQWYTFDIVEKFLNLILIRNRCDSIDNCSAPQIKEIYRIGVLSLFINGM